MSRQNEMKILVLGAGGTGGYFGGRLAEAGADVTFLVRERRAKQLENDGLRIETPKGKTTLRVKALQAHEVASPFDVILLSCKAYDLATSITAIKPAVGATTCIVPLLNGIAHLEALDAAFGSEHVMGGSCQIAAMLTADGIVKSMTDAHSIVWGPRSATAAQKTYTDQLAAAFAKTPVDWKVSDNIMQDMWEKVTFLSTLAGITCLMRATVGEILATPDGRAIMRRYLDACIGISTAEGYAPRAPILERFEKILHSSNSPLTASMLRDLESGNDVEADHIVGYMLEKARHHGLDDSVIAIAYTHLKAYQNRRAAGRLPT
jgi:2-dehydropantoate 2-reductase